MQLMRSGSPVVLWDWDREHIEAIGEARCNQRFLPDYPLPEGWSWSRILSPLCAVHRKF